MLLHSTNARYGPESNLAAEFYGHIAELLENEAVLRLDSYVHHHCTTRLHHSLDVAYISFVIARFLRWDARSAARAGLLHDLFFYDRRQEEFMHTGHLRAHPKIALENARKICALNKREENAILRHMWLMSIRPPRYREGYIVTFADKYCALREVIAGLITARNPRVPWKDAAK